jgi:hypothetical protein
MRVLIGHHPESVGKLACAAKHVRVQRADLAMKIMNKITYKITILTNL